MLFHRSTRMLAIAGVAALAGCLTSNKDAKTHYAETALSPYVERGELPGAISVFYDNGVEEVACLGYADAEKKRPITLDSAFMQCSQTKGFCGVTIAILVEEGKLNLDDPVYKYLPAFKTLWIETSNSNGVRTLVRAQNTLTVRMCLNHTGGFPFELSNYTDMGGWSRRMPLKSVALTAAASPIKFEPGTKSSYSNVGIDIGAAVVETVTGMRWEDFLTARVLKPLGMTHSGFWPDETTLENRLVLHNLAQDKKPEYRPDNGSMQLPYGDDRVFSSAGAGLWTTAADQLKFYKMLMNLGLGENGVRILKPETVKSILALSTRPKGLGGYSLGLWAPEKDGEDAWFGHGGAWGTNASMNWHKKQLKLWVVQLIGGPRPWDSARDKAATEFFKRPLDENASRAYTGRMK